MKSRIIRQAIRQEVKKYLAELKSPEEVEADKAEILAAQAAMKASQAKLKKAQEKAAQKEGSLKLMNILQEKEDDKEEAPAEEAPAEEAPAEEGNPFAAGEAGDKEAEPAGEDGASEKETEKAKQPETEDDIVININSPRVQKYNQGKRFLGTQGVVKKITVDGMYVTVVPDEVDVFVNFNDIE